MTIKLHCFGESGNSYKAALALEFAGLEWESVFVDFFNGATRTPEFRKLNPMGEAPVMQDGDLVLSQSGAIQDYIVEKSGKLGGRTAGEKREVLRWILWDNHKHSSVCGMTRFLSNFMPEEKRPQEVIRWLQMRLKSAWSVLDSELQGRDWVAGGELTIADLSCCGYLYYPEHFGFSRSDWPAIDRWLDRIAGQPSWKHPYDLMPGNPGERAGG